MDPIFFPQSTSSSIFHPLTDTNKLVSQCFWACTTGNLRALQYFLAPCPSLISHRNAEGETLMHVAAAKGHFAIFTWLCGHDASLLNQIDNKGFTPIHHAAFQEQILILQIFIDQIKNQPTFIQQIAENNCPRTLAFILDNGIDPNMTTPPLLQVALKAGLEKNILCLLSFGAKTEVLEEIYDNIEESEVGIELCKKDLHMWLRIFGSENHPLVAYIYYTIGRMHETLDDIEKAIDYQYKALEIRLIVLGDDHPDTAESYYTLGYLYNDNKQYYKALFYYTKVYDYHNKHQTDSIDDNLISCCHNIGLVYENLGYHEQHRAWYQYSIDLSAQIVEKFDLSMLYSYDNLIELLENSDPTQAKYYSDILNTIETSMNNNK